MNHDERNDQRSEENEPEELPNGRNLQEDLEDEEPVETTSNGITEGNRQPISSKVSLKESDSQILNDVPKPGLNVEFEHSQFKKPYGYDELPNWLKSNEFVRHGYRHQIRNVKECFKTIFSRHNETGNIWTHLVGTIMFLVYLYGFTTQYINVLPFLDFMAILIFFFGAISCFAFSTLYHTLMCHSEALVTAFARYLILSYLTFINFLLLMRLDYIGINLMITGSHIPWVYYSFYCRKRLRNTYVASLLFSSLLLASCSLYERFDAADSRHIRSGLFGSYAALTIIPVVHLVYIEGLELAYNQGALGWLVAMLAVYVVGALLYTSRFPERIRPGTFDIFLQSHQLMHFSTLVGSYMHMHVIHKLMTYRLEVGPCLYD